jgi:hypothetical protein
MSKYRSSTLLLTSIPPITKDERFEQRLAYQKRCVESWIKTGHRPISLNTIHEINVLIDLFPDMEFRITRRTTEPIIHRPLVFIHDALTEGLSTECRRISLCNADVLFEPAIPITQAIADDIALAYSNRFDVPDERDLNRGKMFYGIDYANMSKAFVETIPESPFAFGLPWWDYWIPMLCLAKNAPVRLSAGGAPLLRHKIHGDRWDHASFVFLSQYYFYSLGNLPQEEKYDRNITEGDWKAYCERPSDKHADFRTQFFAHLARQAWIHIRDHSHPHDFLAAKPSSVQTS